MAQRVSSAGAVGRQVKILRRLGVSETPVTLKGPRIAKAFRWGNIVMPSPSLCSVSARVCSMGAIKSSIGPIVVLDECRGNTLRTGLHSNRTGLNEHTAVGDGHFWIDIQQRDPFAVDGHLDLFAFRLRSNQDSIRIVERLDSEAVVAIRREVENHRDAAAGSERRTFDMPHLRRGSRHRKGRDGGSRVQVTECGRLIFDAART